MTETLSSAQARRLALAAQGLASKRPSGRVGLAHLRRIARTLQCVQVDPINVLVRAQYLPFFSRLGPYQRRLLDTLVYEKREMFDYVGHEASLLVTSLHPFMRWRMAAYEAAAWTGVGADATELALKELEARGPLTARDLASERVSGSGSGPFGSSEWSFNPAKIVLGHLASCGKVVVSSRRVLEPVYDLPERVLPAEVLDGPTPDPDEARRELLAVAAAALGIATAKDLTDYFRIGGGLPGIAERKVGGAASKPAQLIDDLVGEGRLVRVTVEGWTKPAFMSRDAKIPRRVDARALLGPFDSLLWERERVARLFGFVYRSEIYVPAPKRQFGYYLLPFLLGESLVARVDLKADRKASTLLVQAAHAEDGVDEKKVAAELAAELSLMASWLELDRVAVGERGTLSARLRAEFN